MDTATELKGTLDKFIKEQSSLEAQNKRLSTEIAVKKKELKDLEAAVSELSNTKNNLDKTVKESRESMLAQIDAKNADSVRLQTHVMSQKKEVDVLKNTLEEREKSLEKQNKAASDFALTLKGKLEKLQKAIDEASK